VGHGNYNWACPSFDVRAFVQNCGIWLVFKRDSEYPFDTPKEPSVNKFSMTNTNPSAKLNNHQFELYMAFVMDERVVLTGDLLLASSHFHVLYYHVSN